MLIDDLSSGSMPDLYTAVGGECGAADLQQLKPKIRQDGQEHILGTIYSEHTLAWVSWSISNASVSAEDS